MSAGDWFFTGEIDLKGIDADENKRLMSVLFDSMLKKVKVDFDVKSHNPELDPPNGSLETLDWKVVIMVGSPNKMNKGV